MIIIDGEFTGLDHKVHSLVSLGAVDFGNPENQFYAECRAFDGAEYTDEALKINGFSSREIFDERKQSLESLVTKFHTWLSTCDTPQILIGQNPKSDIDFLSESYKRAGIEYPLGHRSIDLHSIVFMKHLELGKKILVEKGMYKINLDESLAFVGIPGGEPNPHNALMGAKCEAEVFSRVLYGKKLLQEFWSYDIPDYLTAVS